ncbi:MAG: Ku protein [Acidobacteria bacterium]|nr:Ku protein [Acidobacteriota bacterium]
MAARPTWKGYLTISLVTIPVRVFPATDSAATVSFNQLHGECRSRINQKKWCQTCQTEVTNTDIVKGYEFEKGKYVVMEDEDLAKVRPESTRVINVVQFTDAATIDPVYVERPYFLAPDGQVAADAFAVMREGMHGKAALGKMALYGRECLVAILPRENGLIMYTLRHASEVRAMSAIDELKTVPTTIKPDELKLARQVIGNFEVGGDLTQYKDNYQEELRRIIDAKIAGDEIVAPIDEAPPKVVNLMEALRQILERVSVNKKKAAKAATGKASIKAVPQRKRARG